MIDLVHDIINIAERYGLRIVNIDTTDVTLMARIEIFPTYTCILWAQVWRFDMQIETNKTIEVG